MRLPIRISHLGLLESAPLLAAQARGFFAEEGLDVDPSCELGVAAICGKLTDQRIEGACLPAQMPVLLSLGAGTAKVPMEPILVTTSQDMAIVLAKKVAVQEKGRRGATGVLKIGVLGHSSPACHLVKRWLQLQPAGGPQDDPVFVSLAASQLIHFFEEGLIDGFCGLDPLPVLASLNTESVIVATSGSLSPCHPGSTVALRSEFTQERPHIVPALQRALRRGQEFCANVSNHAEVWSLVLAQNPFGYTSDAHRSALARQLGECEQAIPSIRFESAKTSTGLDAQGARFLELACRAALGSADRHLDLNAEIARLYLNAKAA